MKTKGYAHSEMPAGLILVVSNPALARASVALPFCTNQENSKSEFTCRSISPTNCMDTPGI